MPTSIRATERLQTLQRRKWAILAALLLWIASAVLFGQAIDRWSVPAQMLFMALLPGFLIYFLILHAQIRRETKPLPAAVEVPAPAKLVLRNTIVAVTLLYFFDALVAGQGVIASVVSFFALSGLCRSQKQGGFSLQAEESRSARIDGRSCSWHNRVEPATCLTPWGSPC